MTASLNKIEFIKAAATLLQGACHRWVLGCCSAAPSVSAPIS